MNARVSIVMPVHNAEGLVVDSVASMQAQTMQDWELLVVDDASVDDSVTRIVRMTDKDSRIHLIRLSENVGAAVARNTAIREVRGRYVAFCDSDDIWHPQKLEKQLAFMQQHRCPVSFTAYRKIVDGGVSADRIVHPPRRVDYPALLRSNPIGLSTAMYDTELCGKVYMPDIARRQDYGLWLRIMREGHEALGIDEPLVDYRIRKGSLSSNKAVAAWYTWRVLREVAELSLPRAFVAFASYLRASLRKARI